MALLPPLPSTSAKRVCENGEILVTPRIAKDVIGHPAFKGAKFDEQTRPAAKGLYRLEGDVEYVAKLVPVDDMRFLPQNLMLFAKRHQRGINVGKIDEEIRLRFMQARSVFSFGIDVRFAEDQLGAQQAHSLRFEVMQEIMRILTREQGEMLESNVWIFRKTSHAIKGALAIKEMMRERNRFQDDVARVDLEGAGVHVGHIIMVPGTDVHWGDPINFAAKLATLGGYTTEAPAGTIFLSENAWKEVHSDKQFQQAAVNFLERQYKFPNKIKCYEVVQEERHQANVGRPSHPAVVPNPEYPVSVATQCDLVPRTGRLASGVLGLPAGQTSQRVHANNISDAIEASRSRVVQQNQWSYVPERNSNGNYSGKVISPRAASRSKLLSQMSYDEWKDQFGETPQRAILPAAGQVKPAEIHTDFKQKMQEYERTAGGYGDLGPVEDTLLVYPSQRGLRPGEVPRFTETFVRTPRREKRNDHISKDTSTILTMGKETSPLKTRLKVQTTSNYNPILHEYPKTLPYPPNMMNPTATATFIREAQQRTKPTTIGHHAKRLNIGTEQQRADSVKGHLHKYGRLGVENVKQRSTLGQKQSSGQGVIDTFESMKVWSKDFYMPNPPMTRFDGSGRELSPRRRPENAYNSVTGKHILEHVEDHARKKEDEIRDAKLNFSKEKQLSRETDYNIITMVDRRTGAEIFDPPDKKKIRARSQVPSHDNMSGLIGISPRLQQPQVSPVKAPRPLQG